MLGVNLRKYCAIALLTAGTATGLFSQNAWSAPKYITSTEDVSEHKVLRFQDRLSFGFQLYSVIPTARPFQAIISSAASDYRYQISGAFGAELFYRFSEHMDLGISSAFEIYESTLRPTSGPTEVQTARMKLFPVEAVAKWQWSKGVWAPELETGLGVGIFNMSLTSTNLGQAIAKDSSTAMLAHVAGGVSLAWMDDTNIGILLGYRMMFMKQKEFDVTTLNIRRKSLSGVYAKATFRYHF